VGDGANEFIQWLSGLSLSTAQANAIVIKSGGDIKLEDGGDIIMESTTTSPSRIIWQGSNYNIEQSLRGDNSISGASSTTISNLTTGAIYRLTFVLTVSTEAILQLRFNGDSGANYYSGYHWSGHNSASATHGHASGTGMNQHSIARNGTTYNGSVTFSTKQGDGTVVVASWLISGYVGTGDFYGQYGGGYYDGASNLSSVTLLPATGTITGKVFIERLM
jgi:hypothetical protein